MYVMYKDFFSHTMTPGHLCHTDTFLVVINIFALHSMCIVKTNTIISDNSFDKIIFFILDTGKPYLGPFLAILSFAEVLW